MSGKRSRDKGQRGERRCVAFFKALGMDAHRVSALETDPASPVNWDVRVDVKDRAWGWNVQVKEVKKNAPPLPKLMADAHLGFVHYTGGRTFVVIDADELAEFCRMVAKAEAGRRE